MRSVSLFRAVCIAAVVSIVAAPIVARAQGGTASDAKAEQRVKEAAFKRAMQRLQADIADADEAARACNIAAYRRAEHRYNGDLRDVEIHTPENYQPYIPPLPEYPERCTRPVPPPSGGGPKYGPHWVLAGAQPFVGFNVGGGFENTNFAVTPSFNVNSSGVISGGFAGVLFPVPNTNTLLGLRLGAEGGNLTGSIGMPAASPSFTYSVNTTWMAYQEMMVRVPVTSAFKIADNESPRPQDRKFFDYNYFTGSVGIAESGTSVKGTSGTFSVTDNAVRTGLTFTAGVGVPVVTLYNGTTVDLFAQYRGTQWISTVNIPGAVPIASYTNEISGGFVFRFGAPN